jgi:hypothetical protein
VENEVCITKTPQTVCRDGFKPIFSESTEHVQMYCVDRNSALVSNLEHIMQTGHRMRVLRDEAIERNLPVSTIKRCEMPRLKQQTSSFDKYEKVDQYEKNDKYEKIVKFEVKYSRSNPKAEQEVEEKLVELRQMIQNPLQSLLLNDSKYEKAFELIKETTKYEQVQHQLRSLNKELPIIYARAVERVLKPIIHESNMDEREVREVKKQLKHLAHRVYLYTVMQLVEKSKHMNDVERLDAHEQLEKIWNQIAQRIPTRHIESIEKWLVREQDNIVEQMQLQVQADQLLLPGQQHFQTMTETEKKQIQVTFEKVLLGGIRLAWEAQQGKHQGEGSLLGKFFNKEARYTQLLKVYQQKYNFDY